MLPPRRFQPALTLGYQLDLLALAEDARHQSPAATRESLQRAIGVAEAKRASLLSAGVPAVDLRPTVAYLAALRVLRDLLDQGWTLDRDRDGVLLAPPLAAASAADDPAAAKGALRASFSFARTAQLETPSIARFVRDMERRGVSRLVADGPELAARLRSAAAGQRTLAEAVSPVLELVDQDTRDAATGLRLMDVWRYMRLHWSIPYQSTPGRNLFYLVRDDAGPERPVIGIGALGNAVLGLGQRDDALGWSPEALRRRWTAADARGRRRLLEHLWRMLQAGYDEVLHDDLPLDDDRGEPIALALRAVERAANRSRDQALRHAGERRTDDYALIRSAQNAASKDEPVDWESVARTDLYRRKRAGTLADLVEAEYALACGAATPDAFGEMLGNPESRRAIDGILRRIKQRAIAENVMEIITCGAVPPYGEILGGKLVAMLLAAPRVAADFAERYDHRASLIASGIAGRPMRRRARLTVLTTSSLYSVGSSQYNRVRVPGELFGRDGRIAYERIGVSESYGTVHFAPDTARSLGELARLAHENRRIVNNLFGEGMSPKLRALRTGFESLGLPADVFLKHHSPRLLFAVPLAHNARDVLLGLSDRPDYVLAAPDELDGIAEIAEGWRERWLRGRAARADVLDRLDAAPRTALLVGKDVPEPPPATSRSLEAAAAPVEPDAAVAHAESPTEFVERLYRSANSYADRLTPEQLDLIDVDLGLGDHLLEVARAARQVVVTGNPGDGKTHLIARLQRQLEESGAVVIADANVHTDDELLDVWEGCERDDRPTGAGHQRMATIRAGPPPPWARLRAAARGSATGAPVSVASHRAGGSERPGARHRPVSAKPARGTGRPRRDRSALR